MRTMIALLAGALLHSAAAFAADPNVITTPDANIDPARFGWSGGYAGMSAGYAWLNDVDRQFTPPLEDRGKDWVFGAHFGYLQGFGNFIAGAEVEATRLDIDYELLNFITVKNSYALKGRAGVAWDRLLFTGHVGRVYATTNVALNDWGWVYGGGIDYALGDQFTVGGQYSRFQFKEFAGTLIDAKVDVVTGRFGVRF